MRFSAASRSASACRHAASARGAGWKLHSAPRHPAPSQSRPHPRHPAAPRQDGFTGLMLASAAGHEAVARLLIEHKAEVDAADKVPRART